MKRRISANPPEADSSLHDVVASDLSYKIAGTCKKYVDLFPDVFILGKCEYGIAVDALLQHLMENVIGSCDLTTHARNSNFLAIFDQFCDHQVYWGRLVDSVVANGAVGLRIAARREPSDADAAHGDLIGSVSPEAPRVFPFNSQSIYGMTAFPYLLNLYSIGYSTITRTFFTEDIACYDMRHMHERVRFVKAVFRIAEWMSTISGPNEEFHLIPGVRDRTPNGHHITWTSDYLLKELKLFKQNAAGQITNIAIEYTTTLERIAPIYPAILSNVEWGTVEAPNLLRVTRIGLMLRRAISLEKITKEKAMDDV